MEVLVQSQALEEDLQGLVHLAHLVKHHRFSENRLTSRRTTAEKPPQNVNNGACAFKNKSQRGMNLGETPSAPQEADVPLISSSYQVKSRTALIRTLLFISKQISSAGLAQTAPGQAANHTQTERTPGAS